MAKKKTKKEYVKEEINFDFESCLAGVEVPEMLKAGFRYYITINNIPVKSENDLLTELDKFKQTNAGV